MSHDPAFRVQVGGWAELAAGATPIRFRVFVDEQGVPAELELDEFDAPSRHVLALAGDTPIGTGRLLPDGHLGRIAVLAGWRGRGVGTALVEALIAEAGRQDICELALSAQLQALDFYRAFGFVPEGEVYDEAGIPHQAMKRPLLR